jgi:hypothetical protein
MERNNLRRRIAMHLGIEHNTGLVYEADGGIYMPVSPIPVVTQATLIETPKQWSLLPEELQTHPFGWVFREDAFDPVTRVRRGRLFESLQGGQPQARTVFQSPFDDRRHLPTGAAPGTFLKDLYNFVHCHALLQRPKRGEGMTLALGNRTAASAWRIIQAECVANKAVMVTLKAKSAFGVIPELDLGQMEPDQQKVVQAAVERVVDAAFRETPVSVIDQCRNALTVLIARWLVQQGEPASVLRDDLGAVHKRIGSNPHNKDVASAMGHLVARLHSRGKTNEQQARDLRIPVEEDAELAVQAVGMVLRELGWAR